MPHPDQIVNVVVIHQPVKQHSIEGCTAVDAWMSGPPVLFAVRLGIGQPQNRDILVLKFLQMGGGRVYLRTPTFI